MTTIETTPTPKTHTLLLKSHRTTILLYAQDADPLSQIKSQIHAHLSINAANLEALDSGLKIPRSPEEIVLAMPVGGCNSGGGEWVEVEGQDKGICTVASLGVRDCGVLAWRVLGDGEEGGFLVEVAGGEEEEEEEGEGEGEEEEGGNGYARGEDEEDDDELR
ncbi:hypothetical protein B9Z19DRAFT_1194233 [Tuber borchii]|uniref:Uncharacterized protein n=1 Tax=Tuber borchii TaxID=42251 RepID=A0A2T6ZNR7_TUBBO|nr:hypothetical protein B9Z19DRAFT_1194233 [Tuber borchii]